jgi:hypothetical protein
MRTAVAPILLAGLFVAAGLGMLHAIRPFAIRPVRRALLELLAAVGLAYLVGITVLLLIAIGLVVVGVGLTLPSFTALALGVAACGLVIGTRRSRDHPAFATARGTATRADRLVLLGSVVLFAAFALAALTQYTSAPLNDWDAWTIWTRKAIALFSFGTLEPAFWSAKPYVFMHQDYPILLPMLEMLHFRAIGGIDTQSVHVELWFLLVAFPWAFGYLASRTGRAVIWAPIALGAVSAPAVLTTMIGGLADVPVLVFTACGVLALGIWLDRRDRADLAVATILLAGAASIKNEGLVAAVVALAVAALVLTSERPRRGLRDVGIAAGCFLLAILPWQAWAAHAHVPKDVRLGDALNPAYMADHADRVWPAAAALHDQLLDESRWSYFVPLAIVTAVVALVVRRASRAAAFYLGTGAGIFAALVLVYWASSYPLAWYLSSSAYRVVGGSAAVSMAALIHLGPRLAALGPLGRTPRADEALATEAPVLQTAGDDREPQTPDRVPARLAFWRA